MSLSQRLAVISLFSLLGCATPPPPVEVKDIDFKAELARQGEWIVVAPYGRVWHPNATVVGADFVPYVTGGGWVYGVEGWSFETKWPWGKFPFHYGRWFLSDGFGWLWWPDQVRGAAWVEWRTGDGHVGWSPIAPEVRAPRTTASPWYYVKIPFFSARNVQEFILKPDDAVKAHLRAEQLPSTGPVFEQIKAAGGLERDPKVIAVPVVEPEPEAQPVKEEPPPPPPPKKKKRSKHR